MAFKSGFVLKTQIGYTEVILKIIGKGNWN